MDHREHMRNKSTQFRVCVNSVDNMGAILSSYDVIRIVKAKWYR